MLPQTHDKRTTIKNKRTTIKNRLHVS